MSSIWDNTDSSDTVSVSLYLTIMEVAKINSSRPVAKPIILPGGEEVMVNILLDGSRDKFTVQLSEIE